MVTKNPANEDAGNKLVTEVPKQSVDSLKSIFEKSASTVQTTTPKGKFPGIIWIKKINRIVGQPKGTDATWIKSGAPKQEEVKAPQPLPKSQSEVVKPSVPTKDPAPVKENPLKKQFEEERAK